MTIMYHPIDVCHAYKCSENYYNYSLLPYHLPISSPSLAKPLPVQATYRRTTILRRYRLASSSPPSPRASRGNWDDKERRKEGKG